MGCFFSCFPIKNDRHRGPQLVPDTSNRSKSTQEVLASKNRLSALFVAEEKEELESNVGKIKDCDSPKEIRDEAIFLKASGTLQETPIEIRNGSNKFKDLPPLDKGSTPNFHSWLLNSSANVDQSPTSVTPSSCISNVYNSGRISNEDGESRSGEANQNDDSTSSAINTHGRVKSVQFERDLESSFRKPSGNSCQIPTEFDSSRDENISKDYPVPTPLKITDEMQTPGTSFVPNLGILGNGKTSMKKGDVENEGLKFGSGEKSSVEDSTETGSLSSWFKPISKDDKSPNGGNISRFGRTPVDRPIIGMVAAHWNENEASNISPKWWDGKGIPNSTNKYKEDQKVSWHATPFEERLEKALSEENIISKKKHSNGTSIVFEERDTGSSHLQASTHSQSVVSF